MGSLPLYFPVLDIDSNELSAFFYHEVALPSPVVVETREGVLLLQQGLLKVPDDVRGNGVLNEPLDIPLNELNGVVSELTSSQSRRGFQKKNVNLSQGM